MSTHGHILILDDDEPFRLRLAQALKAREQETYDCATLVEARALIAKQPLTHAILDLRLSTESGLDLIPELRQREVKVVMLTGYGSVVTALEAVRRGAANYLSKPVSIAAVEQALFGADLAPALEAARQRVPSLDEVEWEHIQRVLRDCDGNITHAAKRLGIHRQALQRKLRVGPGR